MKQVRFPEIVVVCEAVNCSNNRINSPELSFHPLLKLMRAINKFETECYERSVDFTEICNRLHFVVFRDGG